jgi:hypothetical protein
LSEQVQESPDFHHPGVVLGRKEDAVLFNIAEPPEKSAGGLYANKVKDLATGKVNNESMHHL